MIKYQDLTRMSQQQIIDTLRKSKYVIFGGLGFSGYNLEFNANNGIYQMSIDRETEIKETKKFEELYNYLLPILIEKNSIVLTHTPKKDWCSNPNPDKKISYISGHTHKNFFYDDGEYRVYSDNQVGYHNENFHLKMLLIDSDYDYFYDLNDGIYEITDEQYNDFYRGKNIFVTFQREVNVLYMLKKQGYYCFIHKAKSGSLTILNGGNLKKLENNDVLYYYKNMEKMIAKIKSPLDKFTVFQKKVADIVKKIGGDGTIHGCIIDIDYYNHIYVNPFDFSLTGYFALDIINKIVYPSISLLLEEKCPIIFDKYCKYIKEAGSEKILVPNKIIDTNVMPQIYIDTDIYKASREIKKMQKLTSNILSSWYEDALHNKKITPKKIQ